MNTPPPTSRRDAVRLSVLFGVVYFVQGIAEPTEGLIAQPVRSLLRSWGRDTQDIAAFSALVALPWAIKPLYGLASDFIPLFGYRRRSYLILASAVNVLFLLGLFIFPVPRGAAGLLLVALLLPTFATAFADVAADGLMVDEGRPRGLTGRFQSIQWTAMYAATILASVIGGRLSQRGKQTFGFAICGAVSVATLLVALTLVREPRVVRAPRPDAVDHAFRRPLRHALRAIRDATRAPSLRWMGAYLFLWSFNPFQHDILYLHMTGPMGFSEQFFGNTVALFSAASLAASIAYGLYCRRLAYHTLVHVSIAAGVLATVAYATISDVRSAVIVAVVAGFTYMTGNLIQLDLAARACPPETAATVFSVLMALSNLGNSLSTWTGGVLYQRWSGTLGPMVAFRLLVTTGAFTTAMCWLLVRPLLESHAEPEAASAATDPEHIADSIVPPAPG